MLKMSIGHAPSQAEGAEEHGQNQAPGGLELGGTDGEQGDGAAQQSGAVTTVVGEKSGQGNRSDQATLSQGLSSKKPHLVAGLQDAVIPWAISRGRLGSGCPGR